MRIGELARQTGVSVRSLRYYEERGLLDAQRSGSAHRAYGPDAVARVRLLRQLYAAGLSSRVIASLLPCVDTPSPQITRESMLIMQAEHSRLGEQMQALAETRDHLAGVMGCANQYLEQHPDDHTDDATQPDSAA